jgi:hypothetical protein
MRSPFSRWFTIIIILTLLALGAIVFVVWHNSASRTPVTVPVVTETAGPIYKIIGTSVEGRKIESYTYGHGSTTIAFAGGMHGGYEWNSVLLAYKFIDYLNADPTVIPSNLTVVVIPSINPDGVYKAVGKVGRFTASDVPTNISLAPDRFNAHGVDLNRNFACHWQATSTWQNKIVSAGASVFSEPEAQAIRNFVQAVKPTAFIFWHSQSGTVYASECDKGILPATLDIMNTYAKAAGYVTNKSFDSYSITGDAEGWLASLNIPAITVELKTHNTIEWDQNLAGIKALFDYYR